MALVYIAICEDCRFYDQDKLGDPVDYQTMTYLDFLRDSKCDGCDRIRDCALAVRLGGLSEDRKDRLYYASCLS